jgi:transposase
LVPEDHLARQVVALMASVDFSEVEAKYSSLGRRGYHPRTMVGVWIYASLIGLHESTKVARSLRTDAALRFVAGGHAISAGRLREFRRKHVELLESVNKQVLRFAAQKGLIKPAQLATDSVRLRAHASTKSARTVRRSEQRVEELSAVDTTTLDEEAKARHALKVEKHTSAIAACKQMGRTNIVTTCPSAGLLKFPNGASAPGHRVTMTGAGARERFVLDYLIDADGYDYGKLEGAMLRTRETLKQLGVDVEKIQVAVDAGYYSDADLRFAAENRHWVDVLIAERSLSRRGNDEARGLFSPSAFHLGDDGKMTCPAGKTMLGPYKDGTASRFEGTGCKACPLKTQCTRGKRKYLTVNPEYLHLRNQMSERMQAPDAQKRYAQRMATIEPVFSSIQHTMGFRRLSARHTPSVQAEIVLKVLAHNVSRLLTLRRLLCVRIYLCIEPPDPDLIAA